MRTIFQCNEVLTNKFEEMERECAQHKNDQEPNYRTSCTHWAVAAQEFSARDYYCVSIFVVLQYPDISLFRLTNEFCTDYKKELLFYTCIVHEPVVFSVC